MPIRGRYTPYEWERAKKAIAYLHGRYRETISPDHLAYEVKMDIKLIQELFQVITGQTVHQYQVKIRLDEAIKDLPDFSNSIQSIARKHGFKSSTQFGRLFKKMYGETPQEYRVKRSA
jgi:AraC-like DNA-binding protein